MIVQSSPESDRRFIMTMDQHTALAGHFAAHFGNDEFEAVEPRELMLYVVSNHDAGWRDLDRAVNRDPASGLPYHLVQTPLEWIIETSSASPDFNAKHHAFCELISSMHSWGLYNGRYGMSDKVLLDSIPDAHRSAVDGMLAHEKERQDNLIKRLAGDPATAPWVEDGKLFQSYKQLQFFDTLALYFNCAHGAERVETNFEHVPFDRERDTTVSITPLGNNNYRLSPYPFDDDGLVCEFDGRELSGSEDQRDLIARFEAASISQQRVTLFA